MIGYSSDQLEEYKLKYFALNKLQVSFEVAKSKKLENLQGGGTRNPPTETLKTLNYIVKEWEMDKNPEETLRQQKKDLELRMKEFGLRDQWRKILINNPEEDDASELAKMMKGKLMEEIQNFKWEETIRRNHEEELRKEEAFKEIGRQEVLKQIQMENEMREREIQNEKFIRMQEEIEKLKKDRSQPVIRKKSIKCFTCGRYGHYQSDCTTRGSNKENSYDDENKKKIAQRMIKNKSDCCSKSKLSEESVSEESVEREEVPKKEKEKDEVQEQREIGKTKRVVEEGKEQKRRKVEKTQLKQRRRRVPKRTRTSGRK